MDPTIARDGQWQLIEYSMDWLGGKSIEHYHGFYQTKRAFQLKCSHHPGIQFCEIVKGCQGEKKLAFDAGICRGCEKCKSMFMNCKKVITATTYISYIPSGNLT